MHFVIIDPVYDVAGLKEDAFLVVEQFKKRVRCFRCPRHYKVVRHGCCLSESNNIDAYFQCIKTYTPRKITIGEYSTLVLSDTAVVFAGFDVFARTRDGR